jgi:uncharacterized protein (TIGR03382 family)
MKHPLRLLGEVAMKLSCSARSLAGVSALLGALTLAPNAQALPPEYLANASFHPTDPKVLVVRYESAGGGFLITRDGGKTYRAYPSYAFYTYGLKDRVPFLEAGDGKLLLGVSDAYLEDDGTGCGLKNAQVENLGQSWIADIASHPTDPNVTFIANTGSLSDAKHVGLWKRDKSGALTALGVSEPAVAMMNSVIVRGLKPVARAASMEGVRFFETITRQTYMTGQMVPTPSSALRYSDDLGATWTEHAIPDPDKTAGVARLLAVSNSEPAKILVALDISVGTSDPPDQLYSSTDGGKTFTLYSKDLLSASQALLLDDGKLLVADSGSPGGLYLADAIGMPLRKVFDDTVKCLALQPETKKILMCKAYEIGFFDLASSSFCSTFQFNETVGFVSCPGTDLSTNTKVKDQLCGAWCGPGHYASSPLCAGYNDPSKVCGVQARAWDTQDPDPSKHWIEPPGAFVASRCAGYERPSVPDAGVGTDAGTGMADAGAPAQDSGVSHAHDDAATQPEPGDDDGGDEPDDEKKKGGGCHLTATSSHAGSAGWLALSLLSLLALRRRRR